MSYFYAEHEIVGLSDAADEFPATVREHILYKARLGKYSGAWLPQVFSEDDASLDDALHASLGSPSPSDYMSEEQGWDVTSYVVIRAL